MGRVFFTLGLTLFPVEDGRDLGSKQDSSKLSQRTWMLCPCSFQRKESSQKNSPLLKNSSFQSTVLGFFYCCVSSFLKVKEAKHFINDFLGANKCASLSPIQSCWCSAYYLSVSNCDADSDQSLFCGSEVGTQNLVCTRQLSFHQAK